MKIYEILDDYLQFRIGVLLYFEKDNSYIIELESNLDEWTSPLLFTSYVKRGRFTIPRDISFLWVKERVIPSGRQNIGSILSHHKLKSYNEIDFLEAASGRCSQDNLYIKKINSLPTFAKKRAHENVTECFITEDSKLFCFFADGVVKKVNIRKLSKSYDIEDIEKITRNQELYESVKVGPGGYCITFNDNIDIPATCLYDSGMALPISAGDFLTFVKRNILDTTDSCNLLECSRQNLSYFVKEGALSPVRENVKGNLYLKGDVLRTRW